MTESATNLNELPGLSKPAQRALASRGYETLEQLTTASERELRNLHGMGPKGIRVLKGALAQNGLSFAESEGA